VAQDKVQWQSRKPLCSVEDKGFLDKLGNCHVLKDCPLWYQFINCKLRKKVLTKPWSCGQSFYQIYM